MQGTKENVIEWIKDEKISTVTFTQGRMKSKIRKLAEERPDECQILAENEDGSMVAHIPVKWIKIGPPKKVSQETVLKSRERLIAYHAERASILGEEE